MDIHPFPGSSSITKNAICFFEFDADYPMARHTSYDYTSNTKNILFVVRAVYTVGNYDCMLPSVHSRVVRPVLILFVRYVQSRVLPGWKYQDLRPGIRIYTGSILCA